MGTTTFFDETLHDKESKTTTIDLAFGRSSFYNGENLIFLRVGDKEMILSEANGRRVYEAMRSVGQYLRYDE